jgi:DNA polymerase-3 subunit gamma/tau
LARAWQMLLKGVGEVETAPDRRAAAEMALIRLCHVSDMPSPGDLVRRLNASGGAMSAVSGAARAGLDTSGVTATGMSPSGVAASRVSTSGMTPTGMTPTGMTPTGVTAAGVTATGIVATGGGTRAVVNGAPVAEAQGFVETEATGPALASFRDVAALVRDQREAMLHAHLLHSTHLVRFAPPVIELRTEPDAPRDLAPKLAALLSNATGMRWTIALSTAAGEPTLAAQGNAADAARREEAADHPLIRAIMDAFPGARIDQVRDSNVDDYGLPNRPDAVPSGEPDMPDFAPPDAEFSDESPWEFDP